MPLVGEMKAMTDGKRLSKLDIDGVKARMVAIRGQMTLLDRDVVELYGVATREISQAVRNNPGKFPEGYVVQMSESEFSAWRSKIWVFQVFCGNSDANQRRSANASQKAPQIFRTSISTSPSHFKLRLCRSFQSRPGKFRANSALALGTKHIRRSVSEASLMPSEFYRRNRIRSTKFFEEPKILISDLPNETQNGIRKGLRHRPSQNHPPQEIA